MKINDVKEWWNKKRSDIPDDDAIQFLFDEIDRLEKENKEAKKIGYANAIEFVSNAYQYLGDLNTAAEVRNMHTTDTSKYADDLPLKTRTVVARKCLFIISPLLFGHSNGRTVKKALINHFNIDQEG